MHLGETLVADVNYTRSYLTAWLRAGADNAIFMWEKIHGPLTPTITVFHKDAEDPGSAPGSPTTSTFTQIGSTDFYECKCEGLKELVRFRVEMPAATEEGNYVTYRLLPPTWYGTARPS